MHIGRQVTFYITKLLHDGLYVMMEIGRIEVPGSLRDLVSYVVHLDDLLDVVHVFYNECIPAKVEGEAMIKTRKRSTPTTPEMDRFVESSRDRKR